MACFKGIEKELLQKRIMEGIQLRKERRLYTYGSHRSLNDDSFSNENHLIEIEHILVQNDNLNETLKAIDAFRILCKYNLEEVDKSGTAKCLLNKLKSSDNPELQNNIIACFINPTSTLKPLPAKIFSENGGIEPCISILGSTPYNDIRENILILLDNIALTSKNFCELILNLDVLQPLMTLLHQSAAYNIKLNGIRLIANLYEDSSILDRTDVTSSIPLVVSFLRDDNQEILMYTCLAIRNLCNSCPLQVHSVMITGGTYSRLMDLLESKESVSISLFILEALNSLTNYLEEARKILMDLNVLESLELILSSQAYCYSEAQDSCCDTMNHILEIACLVIANIASDSNNLQKILDINVHASLVSVMTKGEFKARRNAARAFTKMKPESPKQFADFIATGCLVPMCDLLSIKDSTLVFELLNGLKTYLRLSNQAIYLIEECGGRNKIEELQYHANNQISEVAADITRNFFEEEDHGFFCDNTTLHGSNDYAFDMTSANPFEL